MGRGLSRKQRRILSILAEAELVRIRELRNRTGGSRSALSRSITRLQNRGLVERVSIQFGKRKMPALRLSNCTDKNSLAEPAVETKEIRRETALIGETEPLI